MPATIVPNIETGFDITNTTHPLIVPRARFWEKWRLTYEGGDRFIDRYLERFSTREDTEEFKTRRKMTYCPAFAKNSLKRFRNTIFSRAHEIIRAEGPTTYQSAVSGQLGGVDLGGSSMNYFMGVHALEELLKMSLVGIYVDMPRLPGPTLLDKGNAHPYCYIYQAENIRSYTLDPQNLTEFSSLVLVDSDYDYDKETNLPIEHCERYRYLYLKDTAEGRRVFVRFYSKGNVQVDFYGQPVTEMYGEDGNSIIYEEQVGNLTKIPFVLLDIGTSILADSANYQIAHLNVASSDIWYCVRANFPFYTESFSPNSESQYIRREEDVSFDSFSTETDTSAPVITTGVSRGRRYAQGNDRPAFIHPSAEPLTASMAKQEQMKKEIEELMDQALSNLTGESQDGVLLKGVSFVAYVLQQAENKIGMFWAMYEGTTDYPSVAYPEKPQITDPKDIQTEIINLLTLVDKVPQLTFKKAIMKKVARLKLGAEIDQNTLQEIYDEIDASEVILGDPTNIVSDAAAGLVSTKTASKARGYPDDEADKAKKDHADRLKLIADSQTSPDGSTSKLADSAQARGVKDMSANPDAGKQEKAASRDTTNMAKPQDMTRGEGK